MSMNKDLVAQAVAAIPLWLAFLDQKEAEQDALLEQMQSKSESKPASFMEVATSLLKKKKDHDETPTPSTVSPNDEMPTLKEPDSPPEINLGKPKDDIRWAPTEEKQTAAEEEETATEIVEPEEEVDHQFKNMF